MKRILFFIIITIISILPSYSTLVISPSGELVDSLTNKTYEVVEISGTKQDLYNRVKANIFKLANNPENVVDYIDNELISLSIIPAPVKMNWPLMGKQPFWAKVLLKFEFKDNKIRISGRWLETYWLGLNNPTDPITLLTKGSLRCFKGKKGEFKICNEDRYILFNSIAQNLIEEILNFSVEDDW